MQHVRNDIILHLTNSYKIIFVKTNITPKIMINLKKKRGPRSNLPHWKKIIYSYITITNTNKKITCTRSHHMVKTDVLIGHEEIGYLHFIQKNIFHCIFIEKPCIFSKRVQLIMKV